MSAPKPNNNWDRRKERRARRRGHHLWVMRPRGAKCSMMPVEVGAYRTIRFIDFHESFWQGNRTGKTFFGAGLDVSDEGEVVVADPYRLLGIERKDSE